MVFTCQSCHVDFTRNIHLNRHCKTAKHLTILSRELLKTINESNLNDLDDDDDLFEGHLNEIHEENLQDKQRKHNFQDKDKMQTNLINELLRENKAQIQNNQELKLENEELRNKVLIQNEQMKKTINCVYNDNRIVNSTTINITLRAFGKENWDSLGELRIMEIMKKVNSSVPEIIKSLHFDSKTPENHNIVIPNKKIARMKIYDGKNWVTQMKNVTIENLIEKALDKCDDVEDKFKQKASLFISTLWDEYSLALRGNKVTKEAKRNKKDIIEKIECCILDNQSSISTKK
jgi:hypothetical protein